MHDAHAVTLNFLHLAIVKRLSIECDDVQCVGTGGDKQQKSGENVFHNGQPRCAVERQRTRKGKPQTSHLPAEAAPFAAIVLKVSHVRRSRHGLCYSPKVRRVARIV